MRDLKREDGFTLPEVLVTMMLMIVVLFALYSIFDMSLRVFSFGNDKVEAVQNARLGLEKMEREIRGAYPATAAIPPENQISFGNDLDGNRVIECPTAETPQRCETITYRLSMSAPYSLQRISSTGGNPEPVVESVQANGLRFTYLMSDGTTAATSESQVALVRIELTIDVDGRTQILTTDVALRNRMP
jgi:type II secretory pathway pseudopilin PulG